MPDSEPGTILDKAVVALLREREGRNEVLAFDHPLAGVQLVRGTVDPGEDLAAAALRELHEESGLVVDCTPACIGSWERVLDGTYGEDANFHLHIWHIFVLPAPDGLGERWTHIASGSEEEDGLEFAFRWLPVDDQLGRTLHPVFGATVELLLSHLRA